MFAYIIRVLFSFCALYVFAGVGGICKHENRYALSPSPDQCSLWYGVHTRLHCLPRTSHDFQGKKNIGDEMFELLKCQVKFVADNILKFLFFRENKS